MSIFVTGNSGFVGTHFCDRYGGCPLESQGVRVDIRDAAAIRCALEGKAPEGVLHLAAQSSVAASFTDPATTFAVNFTGTLNLLEALTAIGFRGTFLYVGSADVYGKTTEADLPTSESQPLRPRSPYAVSKVAAEALSYQWSQTQEFRVVLTRPFNQIGPGQDLRFAVAQFAHQIVGIRRGLQPPLLVTGDLDVTRDFVDVRDAVRGYRMLLEQGQNGEIYNLCSGQERSLRSLVDGMLQIAGVEAEMRVDASRLRPAEQRRVVGNAAKIRAQIGWEPEIPLETTLADVLKNAEEKYGR